MPNTHGQRAEKKHPWRMQQSL